MNYWPCARYVDNVAKVVNEITFSVLIANAAFLKEMGPTVRSFAVDGKDGGM